MSSLDLSGTNNPNVRILPQGSFVCDLGLQGIIHFSYTTLHRYFLINIFTFQVIILFTILGWRVSRIAKIPCWHNWSTESHQLALGGPVLRQPHTRDTNRPYYCFSEPKENSHTFCLLLLHHLSCQNSMLPNHDKKNGRNKSYPRGWGNGSVSERTC